MTKHQVIVLAGTFALCIIIALCINGAKDRAERACAAQGGSAVYNEFGTFIGCIGEMP